MKKEFNLGEKIENLKDPIKNDKASGEYRILECLTKDIKEFIKKNKKIDLEVIGFLTDLKDLRINDELPFGTCDYHKIEALIGRLKSKDKLAGEDLI